jgi:acyl-CoA synthetase (NDP forming)
MGVVDRAEAPPLNAGRAARVRELLARHAGHPFLLESVAKQVLAEYGIPVSTEETVDSADAAVLAAAAIGGPVALKVLSYSLPHKSDSGALRLGLAGETAVRRGYEDMMSGITGAFPEIAIEGILVQEMVPASLEISCGLQRDPVFGPMVAVGLGGALLEMVGGAVLLRAPFSPRTAADAVLGICAGRLRGATRGLSDAQAAILATVLTGVAELALELPEVESADINPIRVDGEQIRAVDALLVVTGRQGLGHQGSGDVS